MSELTKLYAKLDEIDKQIDTIGIEWFPTNITKTYDDLQDEKKRLEDEIQVLEHEQNEIDY